MVINALYFNNPADGSYLAIKKLRPWPSMTKEMEVKTIDGLSLDRITKLINKLKDESYQAQICNEKASKTSVRVVMEAIFSYDSYSIVGKDQKMTLKNGMRQAKRFDGSSR